MSLVLQLCIINVLDKLKWLEQGEKSGDYKSFFLLDEQIRHCVFYMRKFGARVKK